MKMNPLKNIGITFIKSGIKLIWVLLFGACVTPVDFSIENISGTLVVSGQVSPIQDQNIIQLGLTADTERLPEPLSGATVTLFNDLGESYSYTEDAFSPGSYLLTDVSGVPGRTYHVQITTPSGAVYESIPEKMPDAVGQVSTHFEFSDEEFTDSDGIVSTKSFINIFTNSELPPSEESVYLRWGIEEAFLLSPTDFPDPFGAIPPPCFIVQNADPQRIVMFNGDDIKTTSIENLLIASRIVDWTFLERHYFSTYQSSITKEAYEYWYKVDILANQSGSIFDTPPAEITGNVFNVNDRSDKVLGYFQATNQSFDRFFLFSNDLPFRLVVPTCTFDNRPRLEDYPSRCLDCLTVRNSSFRRPSWF